MRARAIGLSATTVMLALLTMGGCGDDDAGATAGEGTGGDNATKQGTGAGGESATKQGETAAGGASDEDIPADLPNALVLSYAQFVVENGRVTPQPGPARLEILRRGGGEWQVDTIEDEEGAVFHKAMAYVPPTGAPGLLTISGSLPSREGPAEGEGKVKLWRRADNAWTSETLWSAKWGGRVNRMRDAEIADVYGDGRLDVAVGTHDQGVVSMLRPSAEVGGQWQVTELDRANEPTFIHEIEIGDLNGDGAREVYATPSEPNTLEGHEQHGVVVRYVPKNGEGRVVVADLGNRHAKEIWVGDADGDGRDELYVAVEALTQGTDPNVTIVEPVEIRRYDADTTPNAGQVIATIQDRFCRFLTVGDVDGDGKNEMVAAAYSSGLWLLRPGRDPHGEWSVESIDRDSGGFEHASVFADLDGNGRDELYVADDNHGELRRYVWVNGRARRQVIHSRENARAMMTWNITTVPVALLGQ